MRYHPIHEHPAPRWAAAKAWELGRQRLRELGQLATNIDRDAVKEAAAAYAEADA